MTPPVRTAGIFSGPTAFPTTNHWDRKGFRRYAVTLEPATQKVDGLPPAKAIAPETHTRAMITIVRRNWHVLPYPQLCPFLVA